MRGKTEQNKHEISLAALYLLGDAVLFLPGKGSGQYLFLGALAAIVTAFVLTLGMIPFLNLLLRRNRKVEICLLSVLFAAYAFYNGVHCFREFARFAAEILLPNSAKIWIVLIFLAVVLYLMKKPNETMLKLSLLLFGVSVFVIALLLILSQKDYKISNIAIYEIPKLKTLFQETLPFLKSITAPALLFPVYQAAYRRKASYKIGLWGLTAGSLCLIACFAECLLLFGVALSARFPYPLYAAVSTVTVGPLFTRMDGLIYYLFFSTALIKCSLCFRLAVALLRHARYRIGQKSKNP